MSAQYPSPPRRSRYQAEYTQVISRNNPPSVDAPADPPVDSPTAPPVRERTYAKPFKMPDVPDPGSSSAPLPPMASWELRHPGDPGPAPQYAPWIPQQQPRVEAGMMARSLGWLMAAFGIVVMLGSIAPWFSVADIVISGLGMTSTDDSGRQALADAITDDGLRSGAITLVFGLVAAIAGFVRVCGRLVSGTAIVVLIAGVAIAAITAYDSIDVQGQFGVSESTDGGALWGLYLTFGAAAAMAITALVGIVKRD